MRTIVCGVLLLVLVSTDQYGQIARDQERVAIAYEQAGDWRNAARLWQELLQQQPTVSRYLVGALSALKMLGNVDAMQSLFESSDQQARSATAYSYYGFALMRSGKADAAKSAWNKALSLCTREQEFRALASLQIEAGAPSMAAATYQTARAQLKIPGLFAEERAQLAIAAGDITTALDEIFTFFNASSNLSRTQGLVATLLALDGSISEIIERIRNYARQNETNILALRLYEWALRETGDYAAALAVVVDIERRTGQSGRELYAFAERARLEGSYDIALTAYSRLLDLAKQTDLRTMALYGYVQTLEQKTLQTTTPTSQQLNGIIAEYERIIAEYPNSTAAIDALLRIAELERDYSNNPTGALARYEALLTRYPGSEQAARARIERLPLLVRQVGIDSAIALFERERAAMASFPALQTSARFVSAELRFFSCQFESALSLYRSVASNPESPLANDAIERITVISINRSDSTALCRLARAEQLIYQRDWHAGLALLDSIGQDDTDISEYALMRAGSIVLDRADFALGARYFDELIRRFPETIYADRALWGLAAAARANGDHQTAIQLCNQLLARYPNSIYVPRARILIRTLRGDS